MALALVGAGVALVGFSLEDGGAVEVAGGNAPVNAGAADAADIRSHNSPTLAADPTDGDHMVVVNRIDTPRYSCAMHASHDGGASWKNLEIPFPAGEEDPPRCFAPDATFGPDGALYVSFVTLKGPGNVPNAAWVASATRGSDALSTPTRATGPLAFGVRLAADPRRPGHLYLSWLQASETATLGFPNPGNPIVFARSDDGGATWTPPAPVSSSSRGRVVAPSVGVGPEGQLYVLYLDVGDDRLDYHGAHQGQGGPPYPGNWSLVLARSTDGGATWQEAVVEAALVPAERFIVFFPPTPSLAVHPRSGRLYAGFHDGRLGDADVWVWASEDGGASFTDPIRVNDTPEDDGSAQYLPRLAVAPDGRLDVVYYDRRADPENTLNEVSLQYSLDHAETFGPRLRLSDRPFDARIGLGSEREMPDLGSRLGLVADDDSAVAVWADTRAGTQASNKQDLARAVVSFPDASPWRGPLRYLGLGLMAVGVALVLRWALARGGGLKD